MIAKAKQPHEWEAEDWIEQLKPIAIKGKAQDTKAVAGAMIFGLRYLGATMTKLDDMPTREDFSLLSETVVKAANGNGNGNGGENGNGNTRFKLKIGKNRYISARSATDAVKVILAVAVLVVLCFGVYVFVKYGTRITERFDKVMHLAETQPAKPDPGKEPR